MAIAYDWTCSACGMGNAAGADICIRCGVSAITSAAEIEQRQGASRGPTPQSPEPRRLSKSQKRIAYVSSLVVLAGIAMERFTIPPMTYWYIGVGLIILGGIPLFAAFALNRRKVNKGRTGHNDT
jgi:hypothetical protein